MFGLLNPLFAWAALGALVPTILHLLEKRRKISMPFSCIKFLQMANKKSSRRIRFEHFLLWLLRTLLMFLLTLAFTAPFMRTSSFGTMLSRANRDVAIVIDGSFSMDYVSGRNNVWDKTIQTANSIINGLMDGDKVCIYAAEDHAKPILEQLEDKGSALAQIKLAKTSTTSCQLAPAVIAAYDALKKEQRRREREIHILTDGQKLPWRSFKKHGFKSSAPEEEESKDEAEDKKE
ncbi:BatA domain-containing protein, partial [Verrucomicrobiota bacterium]